MNVVKAARILLCALIAIIALVWANYETRIKMIQLPIVVATSNLEPGTIFTEQNVGVLLAIKQIAQRDGYPGYYADVKSLVGKRTNLHIFAGEAVLATRISGLEDNPAIREYAVSPGERHMLLKLPVWAQAGVREGDYVDVIGEVNDQQTNSTTVWTVASQVLVVGRYTSNGHRLQGSDENVSGYDYTPECIEILAPKDQLLDIATVMGKNTVFLQRYDRNGQPHETGQKRLRDMLNHLGGKNASPKSSTSRGTDALNQPVQ